MKYGYARISTEDQNADMQRRAFRREGWKMVFTDKLTGANRSSPGLSALMRRN